METKPQRLNKFVCANCINPKSLKKLFTKGTDNGKCDYCKETKRIIPLDKLTEKICIVLEEFRKELYANIKVNSDSEAYPIYFKDILSEKNLTSNPQLLNDVSDSIICPSYYSLYTPEEISNGNMLSTHQKLSSGYSFFEELTKKEMRFFFMENDDCYLCSYTCKNFLKEISKHIKTKLVVELPKGTKLYRARVDKSFHTKLGELCSPPSEKAISNRMSPTGISMFYCSEDQETAISETTYESDKTPKISIAEFILKENLTIIDLTNLPSEKEDFFSLEKNEINFLKDFVKNITSPIEKDGKEHIEYIPSQIVTEYFRYILKTKENKKINGIAYPSSKNKKKCYVLFYSHEDFKKEQIPFEGILLHQPVSKLKGFLPKPEKAVSLEDMTNHL